MIARVEATESCWPATWKMSVPKASNGGSSSAQARGRKSGRASMSRARTGSAFRRNSRAAGSATADAVIPETDATPCDPPVAYVDSLQFRSQCLFQRAPQLRPGGDAELREEPVEVRLHRSVREIQALADLPVREALCGELRDLKLLRRQLRPAAGSAAANGLAGGTKLTAGAFRILEQAE